MAAIGELDLASAGLLARELDKLRRSGARHIVLDLRRLELIDSTGLRLVLESDALARADGHRFSLVSGPPAVQRVFEISGVLEQLRFVHP